MHSGGAFLYFIYMLIVPFRYLLWTLLVPEVATGHQCETTCVLSNLLFQNCAEQKYETEQVLVLGISSANHLPCSLIVRNRIRTTSC